MIQVNDDRAWSVPKVLRPHCELALQILLLVFLWVMFSASLFASDQTTTIDFQSLSDDQFDIVIDLNQRLYEVDALLENNKIDSVMARHVSNYYYTAAAEKTHNTLSVSQLATLIDLCAASDVCIKKTLLQKMGGFFSFVNIMWFIGIMLLVVSVSALIIHYRAFFIALFAPLYKSVTVLAALFKRLFYFLPIAARLIARIPSVFYELLLYGLCLVLIGNGYEDNSIREYLALTGCFALVAVFIFSINLHRDTFENIAQWLTRHNINPVSIANLVVLIVFAPVAMYHDSQLIGVFAVLALMSWLGFSFSFQSLSYAVGFVGHSVIPRSLMVSAILIAVYSALEFSALQLGPFIVFRSGALYVGTAVYFIGLLIVSSKHYLMIADEDSPAGAESHAYTLGRYVVWQIVTIASGVVALYLGSVYEIHQLKGVGGSLFFLYVFEKFFEIPWARAAFAWAAFLLGAMLFASAFLIHRHPMYFFM